MLADLGGMSVSAVSLVLAQNPAPPAQGQEFGQASPVALVVIILLGIAVVFLIRSMTKHLRRVPKAFDEPEEQERRDSADAEGSPG